MKRAHNRTNLIGQKFNKLEVIDYANSRIQPNGKSVGRWKCKCDCGNYTEVNTYNLTGNHIKSCGCNRHKKAYNNKTVGEISGLYWAHVRISAKQRKYKLLITQEEAWKQFLKQNGKCALTGIELTHNKYISKENGKDIFAEGNASLDRIDSNKDYTIDNIQWIDKDLQRLKNNLSEQRFIELCRRVINYADNKL